MQNGSVPGVAFKDGKQFPKMVHAQHQRALREEKQLEGRLTALRKQCTQSHEEVEKKDAELSEILDDQNELIIRVIEAKLRLQQLYDSKRDIQHDIADLRHETFTTNQQIAKIEAEISEKRRIGHKQKDAADEKTAAAKYLQERRMDEERRLRETAKEVNETQRDVERGEIELRNLDAKYELMRATVQNIMLKTDQMQHERMAQQQQHQYSRDNSDRRQIMLLSSGPGSNGPEPLTDAPQPTPQRSLSR